jgi:1,4-dihydroxy-2-naphthoyl-CoA synthase
MWFLARFYSAEEADKMGLVNKVVPVSSRLVYPTYMQFMAMLLLNF